MEMSERNHRPEMKRTKSKIDKEELDPWKIIKLSNDRREFSQMSLSDKLWAVLHSEEAHYFILALLTLDILVVVALITLHIEYLKSQLEDYEDVVDQCKNDSPNASCPDRDYGNGALYNAESILYVASIVILSIFLVDNVLQLLAKPKVFLKSPLRCFDLAVVVISIALEVQLRDDPEGGLLIIARAWRFARIGHNMFDIRHDELREQLAEKLEGAETSSQISSAFRSIWNLKDDEDAQAAVLQNLDSKVVIEMIMAIGPYITAMEEERERCIEIGNSADEVADGDQFTYVV